MGLPVIPVALCTHILVCVCYTSDNLLNWVNFIRKCLLRSAKIFRCLGGINNERGCIVFRWKLYFTNRSSTVIHCALGTLAI